LHRLRHRDRVPVPARGDPPQARLVRVHRARVLHRDPRPRIHLRLEERSPRVAVNEPRKRLADYGLKSERVLWRGKGPGGFVSGRVAHKMAAPLRQIYDQMLEPKWVIAMGACASSGGMFNNYTVLQGVDKIVAVDVHVPGCPPRPEALMEGIVRLQEKIKAGVPPAYEIRGAAS